MKSGAVTLNDPRYPQSLFQIKNPPENLYFKGLWRPSIFKNCLAVVGSRQMTDYGREMTERLVMPVAQAGITIVSGFMYGIDATAHQACLSASGKTIAVLGCGIDLIRPVAQKELYHKVIDKHGLILSELSGDHPAFRWTFVRRNRIVSGLSQAVLVIEASEKSGALITADLARQQGRQVLALPGPANSKVSVGTAQLIKSGAQMITTAEEILKIYGLSTLPQSHLRGVIELDGLEKKIFNLLDIQRRSTDELARELGQPASQIGTSLSLMNLKGILKQDGQGRYYVNHG